MRAGSTFLVMDDRPRSRARLSRALRKHGRVFTCSTVAGATVRLRAASWTGAVLSGLDPTQAVAVLRAVRAGGSAVQLLLIVGTVDAELAATCHRQDARCVAEPADSSVLRLFAARSVARRAHEDQLVAGAVAKLRVERGLSRREAEVAGLAAIGVSREGLAASLGVSANSIKTHVRGLLRKTGARSVEEVACAVLAEALHGGAAATPSGGLPRPTTPHSRLAAPG